MFRRKKKNPSEVLVSFVHDYRVFGRSSPEFYAFSSHEKVAEISDGESTIYVYCDGEMRYEMADGEIRDVTPEDLMAAGLTADVHIDKAHQQGLFMNNPWFDLYGQMYGQDEMVWFDRISEDLDEAVAEAKSMLAEKVAR